MYLLAESENYIVYSEYETVTMEIRESHRKIKIGDFYGDPEMAVISDDEKFCAMCGCGVIVYYFKDPFREYEYNVQTDQWREWNRNGDVWFEDIRCINSETIELLKEGGEKIEFAFNKAVTKEEGNYGSV